MYGPQLPAQTSLSVEQHRQDVLYGNVSVMTDVDVLYAGLSWVKYDRQTLESSSYRRNEARFISIYGVGPHTVEATLRALKGKYPPMFFRNAMVALHQLKCYPTVPSMEPT